MLKTCKTLLHDVTSPSPPQHCVTGDTAPYTYFIQGLTCGHRLAHHLTGVLAWPNWVDDAHACPVRCSHTGPPDKVPQERCQIGQQELLWGKPSTKQPDTWRDFSEGGSRRCTVCSPPGKAQASPEHRPLLGSSRRRRAASQSRAGSPGFCRSSNSTEIQLLVQEFFRTPHSQSMGQETWSTFERVIFILLLKDNFHICPWLEHLISCWATDWI